MWDPLCGAEYDVGQLESRTTSGAQSMQRSLWISFALFVCFSLSTLAEQIQQPAENTVAEPGGRTISLIVNVTDKSGKPVAGLSASDFTLLDDNRPSKVVAFHAYDGSTQEPDPPIEAIVLFDTVNQNFLEVSYARQQVENFLRQNGGHLPVSTAIYWLTNDGVQAQSEPTRDGNALAAQLEASDSRLRTINRSSGAYGAIELFNLSTKMLFTVAQNEAKKPGRKLLIWAGPGWPMLDSVNFDFSRKTEQVLFGQIIDMSAVMREGHIDLYSISQGTSGPGTFRYESYLKGVKKVYQAVPANLSLKVIAVQSGGLVLPPTNDLAGSVATCMQDATVFYTLTFEPQPADGPNEYHDLKLTLDKPGLTARTNTGYYAQPAGPAAP